MNDVESGIKYLSEYRYAGDDTWYVAGDVYGYDTIERAREAAEWEADRSNSRGLPVADLRVLALVTTSFVVEERTA